MARPHSVTVVLFLGMIAGSFARLVTGHQKFEGKSNVTEFETDDDLSDQLKNDFLPVEKCMLEQREIDRHHVYKAYAAYKFMQATIVATLDEVKEYSGHLIALQNAESASEEKTFVDPKLSQCKFDFSAVNSNDESFIFYLKPTDEKIVLGGKVVRGKVWTLAAEPTAFSRKKWREIKKYYRSPDKSCDGQTCTIEAPYVKSRNEFNSVERHKLNERFDIECQMRGYPQPYMYWTFNGKVINSSSDKFRIKTTWKKTVLEIPFVSDEHEGNYSCIGTNFKDTPAINQFKLELEEDNVAKCHEDYKGYCLNGGKCFHLVQEKVTACYCFGAYGGKRCQYYNPFWSDTDPNKQTSLVPLQDVIGLSVVIIAVSGSLLTCSCLYFAHRSKRYKKKMQKSLNQSFDYSNHLVLNNPSKKERSHYSIVATASPKRWTALTSSFNSGSKNKVHNDTAVNQTATDRSETSNSNKKQTLSKDQEDPRITVSNKKKRSKSSGEASHSDAHSPGGISANSTRAKKDLLTLPLSCPDEVVVSVNQVKRNKGKRHGKSSLLADFDEERSDKSDETDATSTKEHRQSKESATARHPGSQQKQRCNNLTSKARETADDRPLKGQSPKNEVCKDVVKTSQMSPRADRAEMLSDDDSPSPMSSSELSLDKFLGS